MLKLLGDDPEFHEPSSQPMPGPLIAVATGGFKEVNGCIVPASYQDTSIGAPSRPHVNNVDDETGFECNLSKIHLEKFFEARIGLTELARIGCDFAYLLGRELKKSHADESFRVIVSVQLPDPTLEVREICTVRFHKVRGEQVWLDNDLEAYEEEAIAVFDFRD